MSAHETTTRGVRPVPEHGAPQHPHHESPSSVLRHAIGEAASKAAAAAVAAMTDTSNSSPTHHARLSVWRLLGVRALQGVGVFFAGLAGVGAYDALDSEAVPPVIEIKAPEQPPPVVVDECADTQPLVQYIIHVATAGEKLAKTLESQGQAAVAEDVRAMTDVNELPNKIAICTLRAKQAQRQLHGDK